MCNFDTSRVLVLEHWWEIEDIWVRWYCVAWCNKTCLDFTELGEIKTWEQKNHMQAKSETGTTLTADNEPERQSAIKQNIWCRARQTLNQIFVEFKPQNISLDLRSGRQKMPNVYRVSENPPTMDAWTWSDPMAECWVKRFDFVAKPTRFLNLIDKMGPATDNKRYQFFGLLC